MGHCAGKKPAFHLSSRCWGWASLESAGSWGLLEQGVASAEHLTCNTCNVPRNRRHGKNSKQLNRDLGEALALLKGRGSRHSRTAQCFGWQGGNKVLSVPCKAGSNWHGLMVATGLPLICPILRLPGSYCDIHHFHGFLMSTFIDPELI